FMLTNHYKFSKILSITLLFLFSTSHNIYAQNKDKGIVELKDNADIIFDSLIIDFNDADTDTMKVNVLNEIAWHFAPTNFGKSIKFADSALVISKRVGWKKGEAFALKNKGEAYRYNGDLQKSILNHEVSLSIFEKLNDINSVAAVMSNLGITHFQLANYSQSYDFYDKALNIFLKNNNMAGIQKLNVYLGILFFSIDDYTKALEKYNYALNYAERLNDLSSKASIIGNIGAVYQEMKNYNEALNKYTEALDSYKDLNDSYNYSILLGNIGNLYSEQKLYDKAFEYNDRAYKYFTKIGNKYQSAIHIGKKGVLQYYIASDNNTSKIDQNTAKLLDSSITNLKKSISTLSLLGYRDKVLENSIALMNVYKTQKDFNNAFLIAEKVQSLKDTLFSSSTSKKIAELSVEQDLKLQEKEIEILNKDNEYNGLVRNILILFSVLLILFLLFLNNLYKKNQRRNKLLEENITIRKETEAALKKNEIELNKHKDNLELQVIKRTSELEAEVLERKRTEEDLLVAIERVEAANKAKSVFLENMSHELRTPLVGILGYSGLLSSEVPTKDLREMADGINRTGNRLLNTLSMVLDLARIESDKFEINLTEIDIQEELTDIYNNFKGAVSLKKIDFRLEFLDDTRLVQTDAGILKVIIENLVNNAIKFTKTGSISIESKTISENKNKFLSISVNDTGIGIKQNEIQLIFKEFKQLSEGTLKDFQGTGLGLSISKRFTEHLNGELLVESEFGVGSTFTIKLPIS
ncbi:MAG: tetratricopeptide repeat protein, partial [Melioribacteraceae bacterium]|nr:tetratricopeptide repeat protein [Melioribacteraceae bacterium]